MPELELYRKHRPTRFKDVIGQTEAVTMLTRLIKKEKCPHVILLYGASGTGKTTLARIIANKMNCRGTDLCEINAADFRGIDTIRYIRSHYGHVPVSGGTSRFWIIDEAGSIGRQAQDAFLKILEDMPDHAYFVLATTEPQKLLKTIRTRCTEIKTKPLDADNMELLLATILKKEKAKLSNKVRDKIIESADGSPRKALVLLHQVLDADSIDEQINIIQSADSERQAVEIARILLRNPQWKEVASLIKAVDEEPETIRRLILGYVSAVALNGGMPDKCADIIARFSNPYYDVGKAGLVWSAYHCCAKPNYRRR